MATTRQTPLVDIKFGKFFRLKVGHQHEDQIEDQAYREERKKKIKKRLLILTLIFNSAIIPFSFLLLILFPGNLICQSENVFFTSLAEKHIRIFLLVISIVGIVALCFSFKSRPFVITSRFYLAALLVLTVVLFAFIVFGFVVTKGGGGEEISGKAYKEYRLKFYSNTLQARISRRWNAIRTCLVDRKICKSFIDPRSKNLTEFNATSLSPIESGCCKPSNDCGFIFISPTNWTKPDNANVTLDCGSWSNDNEGLCYDCDACKAGMLQSVKDSWRMHQAVFCICFEVFLIIVFIAGYRVLPWKEAIDRDSLESQIITSCVPTVLRYASCPCWGS